jgi:hypothetical protein
MPKKTSKFDLLYTMVRKIHGFKTDKATEEHGR